MNNYIESNFDITNSYFDKFIDISRDLFNNKINDYGLSWLILRPISLIDQLLIKAKRIRNLEEISNAALIPEGREIEFIGIINYCIIGLIMKWFSTELPDLDKTFDNNLLIDSDKNNILKLYDKSVVRVKELLLKKNHDYGEAWREMDSKSITDQILVKLYRTKNILQNPNGLTVSEDIDAQLSDILNYSIFSLIKLLEDEKNITINN